MTGNFIIDESIKNLFVDLAKSERRVRQASGLRKSRTIVKALEEMDFDEHTRLASPSPDVQLHIIRGLDDDEPNLEVGVVVTPRGAYAFHAACFQNVSEQLDIRASMIMLAPTIFPSTRPNDEDVLK